MRQQNRLVAALKLKMDASEACMDIHPPMKKIESLKEYGAHILVVTIGILIALGLEGIRESWREHVAVNEARESFQRELRLNQHQLELDQLSIVKTDEQLDELLKHYAEVSAKPEQLKQTIDGLQPGFYFFSTTEWESALSTGVLAHMNAQERTRFMNAYISTKNYQGFSEKTYPVLMELSAFAESRQKYSEEDKAQLLEKIILLRIDFKTMVHLGGEMQDSINDSVGKPGAK